MLTPDFVSFLLEFTETLLEFTFKDKTFAGFIYLFFFKTTLTTIGNKKYV